MSLAISTNNKKDYARFNITLFYFILAIFQYFISLIIFYENISFPTIELIFSLVIGIILGNILNNYISEKKYKFSVNILALISSIFLISK